MEKEQAQYAAHTQIYTGKQADEYGQKHEQHTALVLFFHSIHLIQ